MRSAFRLFSGFSISLGFSMMLWELIKLLLNELGGFGYHIITRSVILFCIGFFFALGWAGISFHRTDNRYKTILYGNILFVCMLLSGFIFLARAFFFWEYSFSLLIIVFTAGHLLSAMAWRFLNVEVNKTNFP